MSDLFINIVLLFFIYSVIGWLWETVYCSICAKKFVYRGFLYGPYCPVYGFGVLSVLYLVEPFENNILVLYVFSALLVTVIEYIAGIMLDKLFHVSLWDYSKLPLNLQGYVALPISLFWGLGCVLIVKIIQPEVMKFISFATESFGVYAALIVIVLMLADTIKSITSMVAFQKMVTQLSAELGEKSDALRERAEVSMKEFEVNLERKQNELSKKLSNWGEKQEAWRRRVKENSDIYSKLPKLKHNERRWMKAYSKLNVGKIPDFNEFKEKILSLDAIKKRLK